MPILGSGESDRALKRRIRRDTHLLRELDSLDPTQVVREGRQEEVLSAMSAANVRIEATEKELARRRHIAWSEAAPLRRALREAEEEKAAKAAERASARRAFAALRYFAPPELEGAKLDPGRLSRDEGDELLTLVRQRQDGGLDESERERFGVLLGKAAGDEGLFARAARERALIERHTALAAEERAATLPEHTYSGRGLAVLPGYLLDWLEDPEDGSLTVADVGVLATLLLSFASRRPLVPGAYFVEEEGATMLVCPGALDDFRFLPATNPDVDDPDLSGRVRERAAVRFLALNEWFLVSSVEGRLTIRLGPRAREVGH